MPLTRSVEVLNEATDDRSTKYSTSDAADFDGGSGNAAHVSGGPRTFPSNYTRAVVDSRLTWAHDVHW